MINVIVTPVLSMIMELSNFSSSLPYSNYLLFLLIGQWLSLNYELVFSTIKHITIYYWYDSPRSISVTSSDFRLILIKILTLLCIDLLTITPVMLTIVIPLTVEKTTMDNRTTHSNSLFCV